MNWRIAWAILLPFLALALQWALWPWIKPFVWFLFFPSVFFSARLGGLRGGLASTLLSTGMVWYFFIPPQLSWAMTNPANLYSVVLFLAMGYLFSDASERLMRAQRATETALAETQSANEKITQLYEKTLELDELKTQFFANVSHELRTPLTLIMSPLARRLGTNGLSAAQRREDEMMLRNARLLYRHVCDLLDVAKLEAGGMSLDYVRIDLGGVIRGVASQFEALAQERDIEYHMEIPASLEAAVDSEKVQRVLINLLSNALKFTPEGGRIEVRLRTEGGQAIIEVQDNGPGIPDALREAVFERFRQVEGGTQRRHGGTGLGLAIVKEFTALHGGGVALDEAPGGGARFTVRLPLQAPADALVQGAPGHLDSVVDRQMFDEPRPAGSVATRPRGNTPAGNADMPLILVVEDNADMNAYIAAALEPDYRVACAFDGREGLEKALALHPDLILSDVMMPVMSGDQMVLKLREHPHLRNVPIVMLTAKADDSLRVRMLKEGVQDYLNKPFSMEELLARVGGLVATRRHTLEALRRREEFASRVIDTAPGAMLVVNALGRIIRVNTQTEEIFGYPRQALLGQPVEMLVPAPLRAHHRALRLAYGYRLLPQAMALGREVSGLHKDGHEIALEIGLASLMVGEDQNVIAAITDTARKQADSRA